MKWNIIWQVDPDDLLSCVERDWFAEMLSLVPHSVQVDYEAKPLLTLTLPNSIVCVSCPNQTRQSDLIEYLQRVPPPRVLYHMSDEFLEVGHDVYQHCELVIRDGFANFDLLDDPRILQIPVGYVTGLGNRAGVIGRRSSQRKCSFAFLGTIKQDRVAMLGALQKIPGQHFVWKTELFAAATKFFGNSTIAIYKNAVFAPDPKGNWNPECNRLYNALEWGCIPLIKRYSESNYQQNYHARLFGNHPLPIFGDWSEAADFATQLLSDPGALDTLQSEIFTWWQNLKTDLQAKVASKLASLTG